MFNLAPSHIRFWEKEFDSLKPHKNKKGNRLFTQNDIQQLKLIHHLVKEKGMTIKGARQRLKDNRDEDVRKIEILDRLIDIREMIKGIREELQ